MSGTRARRLRTAAGACALTFALSGALSGCGMFGEEGEPEIAANVAGTTITAERVNELFAIFAGTEAGAASLQGTGDGLRVSPEQARANVLSYEIKVVFLDTLAARESVTVPESAPGTQETFDELAQAGSLQVSGFRSEDFEIAARAEAIGKAIAVKLLPEVTVTDEEVQDAYDERDDIVGESFKARTDIAFMATAESASALREALADGTDFTTATDALDETVAAETVDINPLTPIQADLIETVRTLDAGETAEPVRYDIGDGTALFVVLHQQKREDLPRLSVEEAKPELIEIITNRKRKDVYDQWLRQQYVAADIDVDEYYGRWEPNLQAVI